MARPFRVPMRNLPLICFVLPLALLSSMLRAADPASAGDAKLREALRNTTLQLRTIQTERDSLQAAKEEAEAEKKALSAKLDALTKENAATQAASEKMLADLRDTVAKTETENTQVKGAVEKWKAAYQETAATSEKREAARAHLNTEKIELQRKVADQQRKNQEMFKIGTEILNRYENFGLGTAITAREPFVGTMRVKLQNLVQDYGDKLSEQRIKP